MYPKILPPRSRVNSRKRTEHHHSWASLVFIVYAWRHLYGESQHSRWWPLEATFAMGVCSWSWRQASPVGARRATDVSRWHFGTTGTGEDQYPTHPDASFPRVLAHPTEPIMPRTRRVMIATCPCRSKSATSGSFPRPRWMDRVCRRRTVGPRQNLPLNPLNDLRTMGACSTPRADVPPGVKLVCTGVAASTHTVRGCSGGSCPG